jgi:hypothetical protein
MKYTKESLVNESKILTIKAVKLKNKLDKLKLEQYKIITKYKTLTNEK